MDYVKVMVPNLGGFEDNFFNIKSFPQNHPIIHHLFLNALITSIYIYMDHVKTMGSIMGGFGDNFSTPKVVPKTTL